MMRTPRASRSTSALGVVVVAITCVVVAAALTSTVRLPAPFALPPEIVVLGLVFALLVPILLARWRTTFWLLLAWFMVEDLIRKYLGNDIRVYFMKDVLFLVLLAGMVLDPRLRGMWTRATGSARFWLYAIVAWSLVLAVPTFFTDWRIPIIGLKLDWEFVPLVVAGFAMAAEIGGVRSLLTGLVGLGVPVCLVGIIQAYVGPDFLSPGIATPLLRLDLTRAYGVFQPTGPFVDQGRFGAMALIVFVSALGLLLLAWRDRRNGYRSLAIAGVLIGGGAVWANAGKSNLIVAAAIAITAVSAPAFAEHRPALMRAAVTGLVVIGAIGVMFAVFPQLSGNRVQYLTGTLDPNVSGNDWGPRFATWSDNTERGLQTGGLLGAGTGSGSLGLQYLTQNFDAATLTGVAQVEGGYAVVALQWGVLGLALWLGWTLAWVWRQWLAVRSSRGTPLASVGLILLVWMVMLLFVAFVLGFQGFQNYYANAYFWLLSGVLFALPYSTDLELVRPSRLRASAGAP